MRELADAERIRRFMSVVGAAAEAEGACYFTGGATAVLVGWRPSTVDVDVLFVPEQDSVLRALTRIKDELSINVELVSPADFIPVPAGWEERGVFAGRAGRLSFYHFDPYAQALAKLERAHAQDLADVEAIVSAGLIDAERARGYFLEIEPNLYRYPAVDPPTFRRRVDEYFGGAAPP